MGSICLLLSAVGIIITCNVAEMKAKSEEIYSASTNTSIEKEIFPLSNFLFALHTQNKTKKKKKKAQFRYLKRK